MAKQKLVYVKLLDTGQRNEYFALRISMPTKDYRPRTENETKSIKSRGKVRHKSIQKPDS